VFCGRHLLDAKLRRANIDPAAGAVEEVARIVAQIRRRWPLVRILLRADSGFAREELIGTDSSTCPLQASEDSNVFETARQRNCIVPQRMARTGRSAMAVLLFRPTARLTSLTPVADASPPPVADSASPEAVDAAEVSMFSVRLQAGAETDGSGESDAAEELAAAEESAIQRAPSMRPVPSNSTADGSLRPGCGRFFGRVSHAAVVDSVQRSQFSILRSLTRENSRSLSVTTVCPNISA
jgi:hypothetical protein